MMQEKLKQIIKDKYWWLVLLAFGLILTSRLLFLGADLPSTHVEIEEKFGGYNARNMIFLKHWPLYNNWFQPMVWAPIQNLLSYISFGLFGVGLVQFRFPMVLATFFGLVFFFLILLKQTNRTIALFGLLLYAFCFEIAVWNRSGLCENLYLLLMPLSTYFLTKKFRKNRQLFFFVLFAGLTVVAKLDGYPFFLSALLFLFFWSLKKKSFLKIIKPVILGSLSALAILLILYTLSDSFKYFLPTYDFYLQIMVRQSSFLKAAIPSLLGFISLLLKIDPYIFLAFLISLPIFFINYNRLNKIDWFIATYLIVVVITRLQIPTHLIYWKRSVILFFPIFYVIFRSLFLLWSWDEIISRKNKIQTRVVLLRLIASSVYSLLICLLYFNFFNKSILRNYNFAGFSESFHYSKGSFFYLFLIFIAGIVGFNWLLFAQNRKVIKMLIIPVLFFVSLSFLLNTTNVAKMFLPWNIRYSYQDNLEYSKMLPEGELIVSHEQGFRAFAYLVKDDFYFNHDGGVNPMEYREVLESKDSRYFITNVEEFWFGRWGITNKFRLGFVKEAYPNLKLLGVVFASRVPLAIYDKYGE